MSSTPEPGAFLTTEPIHPLVGTTVRLPDGPVRCLECEDEITQGYDIPELRAAVPLVTHARVAGVDKDGNVELWYEHGAPGDGSVHADHWTIEPLAKVFPTGYRVWAP